MTRMKAIGGALALLVVAALAVWPAAAADKGGPKNIFADAPMAPAASWTGAYVGLHGGYGAANAELTVPGFGIDGLSATGPVGGIHAGYDVQIPGSFLVLGARAGYTWGNVEFSVNPAIFNASIDNGWSADGRIGAAIGSALPYVFGGWTVMNTSATAGTVGIPTPDLKGWRGGAGVEFRLPKLGTGSITPTLALEYTYTDFQRITPFVPLNVDVTQQTMMGRLNLRFGQ